MTAPRLPQGVRDYLPAAAAERRAIAESLLAAFDRWGYRRIITPAFEYEATLARASQAAAIRFVEPVTGEVVALRPDITPQVARLVATRFADENGPIRLSYEGSVVRNTPQRELFQAGVELIDAPSPAGDVEVIALAREALAQAGVEEPTIDLGCAEVAREALADVSDEELRRAIARKDAEEVARRARALRLPAPRRKLIEALPSLYGGAEAIDRAARLVGREARAGLRGLAEIVRQLDGGGGRITVDLGEVRGFDYYTGVRFQGFAAGVGDALVSGGRYDHLVERYGRAARAAGFAVDVEKVADALRARGGRARRGATVGVLLAGEPAWRREVAAALRRAGARVAEHLGEDLFDTAAWVAAAEAAGVDFAVVLAPRKRGGARFLPTRAVELTVAATGQISAGRLRDFIAGRVPLDALLPAG